MDPTSIDHSDIAERYLSGDLTLREAREFEKYCLAHPEAVARLPIPVRLKARLAGRRLTEAEARANHRKSKVRARIEHVFGAQENAPGGRLVRTIGIVRAKIKIGLQNFAYNIRRLVILERAAAA